jgi:Tol biopolymer transport system component
MIGSSLGSYRILGKLGEGGMGEVYRAHDSKLGRDVAIKILPERFQSDPNRLARFDREARALAAVNHSNIAAIYGVAEEHATTTALVLELVEGKTLAERLRRGPIPVQEAIDIAKQMAAGLDAAHGKDIIHRDLKPSNIKITPERVVKILDFGLAKAFDEAVVPGSSTVSVEATRDGAIVGTAAYMSPEQARAQKVDRRTDIWAFGCVLYEMLTGKQAFGGATISDSIAAILDRDPDWNALPTETPPSVRRLLQRCLEKDPQRRLRDIGEVPFLLAPEVAATSRLRVVTRGATLIVAAGLIVAVFLFTRDSAKPFVAAQPMSLTDFNDSAVAPSLSPDGRMLTFIRGGTFGNSVYRGQVYVKLLPNGEPVQLTRDESSKEQPVFSPDASRIVYSAFTSGFRWDSWQVPVLGGAPQPFLPNASGLVWIDPRQLMYSEIMSGIHMGIVTSTESRSEHRSIYFPPTQGGMAHRSALSPDGKSVLIVEMDGGGWLPCRLMPFDGSNSGHAVGPPASQCTTAAWSPDGQWMYFSSSAENGFHIWRQWFPDGLPEQITFGPTEQEGTAISTDGKALITSMGTQLATISLHDPAGEHPLTSETFAMLPTFAPSVGRVFYLVRSVSARAYASGELWSVDLTNGQKERMFPGRVMGSYSISPDAKKVVFTTAEDEADRGVWIADLDRRAPPRQLTKSGEFRACFGTPGEIVYLSQGPVRYLYRMKEDGSENRRISPKPIVYLISVSPDGKWAVALDPREDSNAGGMRLEFVSLAGEPSITLCSDDCSMGFGPARVQAPPIHWSLDGKLLSVSLEYFGLRAPRTVFLPYRSDVPLARQYPKGLKSEADLIKNPGAKVINEPNVFPATASSYLVWRLATQSNLYQIPIPR